MFLELRARRSSGSERTIDDVAQIARKILRRSDTAQCDLGAPASRRLEGAPRAERGAQSCCNLRVLRIEFEHRVGEELEARAIGTVELRLIGLRKAADQR